MSVITPVVNEWPVVKVYGCDFRHGWDMPCDKI